MVDGKRPVSPQCEGESWEKRRKAGGVACLRKGWQARTTEDSRMSGVECLWLVQPTSRLWRHVAAVAEKEEKEKTEEVEERTEKEEKETGEGGEKES